MSDSGRLGRDGEAHAAAWLEARGYLVVERNARAGGVEIDLVVRRGSLLAFVEVKARSSRRAGAPEEAVDRRKRRRLARGAAAWLAEHRPRASRVRFDVVTCEPGPDGSWEVRHLPGAFETGG